MATPPSTIFLIEDSKDIQNLIGQFFKKAGYQVDAADNGEEALRKLSELPKLPDLIFLDLMMPEMDGIQFREAQIKDLRLAKIPVVLMTADLNAERQAKILGVSGFMRKPFSIDSLLKTAAMHCKQDSAS